MALIGGSSGTPYMGGGGGMEPMTMMALASIASNVLGGLFGGDDGPQERKPYQNHVSPQRTLEDAMSAIKSFGAGLEQRQPYRTSAVVPPGAAPVRVPGLNFQIGGGLGMDPALFDKSLLQTQGQPAATPFQSLFGASQGPGTAARRRSPGAASTGSVDPSGGGSARRRDPWSI